jgi:nucleoside-diphosphate-sugar epimerase
MSIQKTNFSVVTGAFGYSGKYITRKLLDCNQSVLTLTGHPERPNEFGGRIQALPYNFNQPENLANSLQGADTLYNTYWVRFDHGQQTFARAVANTKTLFQAAKSAGVGRIVHISITNPSTTSNLPYFRNKALLEAYLQQLGVPFGIVRPTVVFGKEDILINNIAYLLRHMPVFAVPGTGKYRLQPVYVEDLAELCLETANDQQNKCLDAAGPEIFTFDELIRLIQKSVSSRARIVHLPPRLALFFSKVFGVLLNDVLLTRDELSGLMNELLVSKDAPTGRTCFSRWVMEHGQSLGANYASELERHYKRG